MSNYTCWNCGEELDSEFQGEHWYTCSNCDEPQGDNSAGKWWREKCMEARQWGELMRDKLALETNDGDVYIAPWETITNEIA